MATVLQNLKYLAHSRNHKFWREIKKSRETLELFKVYETEQDFIKDNVVYSAEELRKITGGNFIIKNGKIVISVRHENGMMDLVSTKKVKISLIELKKEAQRVIDKFKNKLNNDEQSIRVIIDYIIFDKMKDEVKKLLDITLHYEETASRKRLFFKIYKNAGLNKFKDYWRQYKNKIEYFKNLVEEGKIKIVKKTDCVEITVYSNTCKQDIVDIWTKKIDPLLSKLAGYKENTRPLKEFGYDDILNKESEFVKNRKIDKTKKYKISKYEYLLNKAEVRKRTKLMERLK